MSRPAELTPRRLLCSHCGRSVVGSATCKRRSCPGNPRLWALDWRVVLLENLIAYGGKAVMFTLTPPGADVLPWDRSKCGHEVGECSGPAGCIVRAPDRWRWNASFPTSASRAARWRAPRYSFGHLNAKFVKPKPSREAAALLTEAVTDRELPSRPLFVSPRLTRVTRTTMRNKRRQRHLFVCNRLRACKADVVARPLVAARDRGAIAAGGRAAGAVRNAGAAGRPVAAAGPPRQRRPARRGTSSSLAASPSQCRSSRRVGFARANRGTT